MKSKEINICAYIFIIAQALFIALKILKIVLWSWWWVLSPTIILFSASIISFIIFLPAIFFSNKKTKKKSKEGCEDKKVEITHF
ncbi:hypothetical protein ETU10_08480 [Apibacter muscae]|uniref:hypothetical protein n=1 Tax=Apibacter muscae TaxID=2509004 RepID=UPI0011AD1BC9|nr:hypothetical protein [Apibacter muscae]TWP23122.1 hypothetical protein ETU10_08480 [Apibacter muscae]